MGCLGPIWTPNLGYALIYGVPWPYMDPNFRESPHLWGALAPYGPQKSGFPYAPYNSGIPSFWGTLGQRGPQNLGVYGAPWAHMYPKKLGVPLTYGGPKQTPNLGVPLLHGVSSTHVHPKSRGSPPHL